MKEKPIERQERSVERPERVPLGTRNVLTTSKRPGYVRRFVNNEPGRVERFKLAGYSVVQGEVPVGDPRIGRGNLPGSAVSVPVGGGQNGVLMEIKEEYYKEDQKAKQNKILKTESEMRRNLNSGEDGINGRVSFG